MFDEDDDDNFDDKDHYDRKMFLIKVGLFNDLLTIVDYLIPNLFYTYILNIYMTCKHIL